MRERIDRRDWLKQVGMTGLAATSTFFAGCGGNAPPPDKDAEDGRPALEPIVLTYADTPDFNRSFNDAVKERRIVRVNFDGSARVTRESPFYKMLVGDTHLTNRPELAQQLHGNDTATGRAALRQAFADELLQHEQANQRIPLPNGQVIEPTTVVLIIALVLIVAGTSAAITQIVLHGPVQAKFGLEGTAPYIEFAPA